MPKKKNIPSEQSYENEFRQMAESLAERVSALDMDGLKVNFKSACDELVTRINDARPRQEIVGHSAILLITEIQLLAHRLGFNDVPVAVGWEEENECRIHLLKLVPPNGGRVHKVPIVTSTNKLSAFCEVEGQHREEVGRILVLWNMAASRRVAADIRPGGELEPDSLTVGAALMEMAMLWRMSTDQLDREGLFAIRSKKRESLSGNAATVYEMLLELPAHRALTGPQIVNESPPP